MKNEITFAMIYSLLETLKLLRDDVTLLHESAIPLLPTEEQIRQNEWYSSDVKQSLSDLKFSNKASLTQIITFFFPNRVFYPTGFQY